MELILSETERQLLLELLQGDLGEIRVEVRRTEDAAYRTRLHEQESCLRGLIERMQSQAA